MDLDTIVKRCEDIYHDLDFHYVQDWKNKHNGKAIGFMPVYVPREVIHAAGMLPVGIMGAGEDLEIIRGDAYFQSYICRIPRSTIELGVSGKLDCLDGFLFPAICDVIRNLSGMWKIMFPGKFVRYMDFPQDFGKTGRTFYRSELTELCAALGGISGREVTKESLAHSVRLYNENRRALKELYQMRAVLPHKVLTYEVYLLLRASNVLEISEHTQLVKDYMAAVVKKERPMRDYVRVVVSGAFCEQPPLALIRALESSGCYIVDDDWMLGARYLLDDVKVGDDPLGGLIDGYMTNTVATASRYEGDAEKGRFLIEQVRARRAEGVIFAAPSFCDPALLERPMLQEAVSKAEIPNVAFKYAENTGQIQVIKEETGTFADSIKLWGA
jgi:benzoyl-CoA reductase subunit C